jgi:predicted metal-dependent phosphoesterase TrpH|tara:strand:+ start:1158 stop:1799 length:642 start_codon:yes stop_codon:yes gene_type:complete
VHLLLDLHTHSIKSDDGRAKVENYCQWIKAKALPLDGFVLTEHRQFDDESDYSALAEKFGLCILKASEVETEYGHVLVYGVTPELQKAFDFASTHLELAVVLSESKKHGAMAVPCHPGRPKVGMFAHTDELGIPEGVEIVEIHNGGSRDQEDQIAIDNAEALNYRGIAGSDSHIVSHIGRCATKFSRNINSINDLVEALKAGDFEAVNLKTAG